jgi:hypothetical protein
MDKQNTEARVVITISNGAVKVAESPEPPESLVSKSLPALIPLVLSLLAASALALLRNGYVTFYSQYGVRPEDVGLGQQDLLTGVLRFCVAGSLERLVFIVVTGVAVWWGVAKFCTTSKRFKRLIPATRGRAFAAVAIYLSILLVGLLASSLYWLPVDQDKAERAVSEYRSVHPSDLRFLMIQADPAYVTWARTSPELRPSDFPVETIKVMYLGHRENMAVVVDPKGSTWRVPTDKALIRITGSSP